MSYRVDPNSDIPPSRQLVERLLEKLACGEILPEERLPSVRIMAGLALVNPNTVVKAYRELESLGAVQCRNGSGVYASLEGPEIAVKRRKGDTFLGFQRAVREALGAGHNAAELLGEMAKLMNGDKKGDLPVKAGAGRKK
jgi:GntR family transcriptional regulator